jgi:hypothetical protein
MSWDDFNFYDSTPDVSSVTSAPIDYSAGFGEWASPVDTLPQSFPGTIGPDPTLTPYTGSYSDVINSQGIYPSGGQASVVNGGGYGQTVNPDPSSPYGVGTADYRSPDQSLWEKLFGSDTSAGGGGVGGLGLGGMPGLLGLGSLATGLIGALAGGGITGRTTYPMSAAQRAQAQYATQSLEGLNPFIQGTSPLQQQQGSILSAIASGQIPSEVSNFVRASYAPVLQNLWTDAAHAGQSAGFYDAPATSPAGGAILGPGLAQAQGQMAGSILDQMNKMPALYNTPIQNQMDAAKSQATGYTNNFRSYQTPQQQSVPLGAQVGQGLSQGLSGMGQGIQQNQQNANNQNFQNQMMSYMLRNGGGNQPMSGAPYDFAPTYGG